jgi:hypothetical protein
MQRRQLTEQIVHRLLLNAKLPHAMRREVECVDLLENDSSTWKEFNDLRFSLDYLLIEEIDDRIELLLEILGRPAHLDLALIKDFLRTEVNQKKKLVPPGSNRDNWTMFLACFMGETHGEDLAGKLGEIFENLDDVRSHYHQMIEQAMQLINNIKDELANLTKMKILGFFDLLVGQLLKDAHSRSTKAAVVRSIYDKASVDEICRMFNKTETTSTQFEYANLQNMQVGQNQGEMRERFKKMNATYFGNESKPKPCLKRFKQEQEGYTILQFFKRQEELSGPAKHTVKMHFAEVNAWLELYKKGMTPEDYEHFFQRYVKRPHVRLMPIVNSAPGGILEPPSRWSELESYKGDFNRLLTNLEIPWKDKLNKQQQMFPASSFKIHLHELMPNWYLNGLSAMVNANIKNLNDKQVGILVEGFANYLKKSDENLEHKRQQVDRVIGNVLNEELKKLLA